MSSDLSKRIANLSPEKRAELLKKVAAQNAAAGNTVKSTISVRTRSGALPLSFAQQRMWFIDQLEPGSPLYNLPVAVRLEGALDTGVLERALREVVRRHESLRTTFQAGESGPVQAFSPEPVLALATSDLTGVPVQAREAEAWRQVDAEARRPFDLAKGPLLRALLLKLGEAEHLLVVVMHHIVSDGWSQGVLVREVAILYGAFAQGQPSPLPELAVQYADYGVWQQELLRGEVLEKQLGYWRKQLAGAPPTLDLPTDKPRPAARGFKGARHGLLLSRALGEGLKGLAQREGASLFMVLLAGWQVLLSRYAGQEDVSVGSPIAGRTRAEVEGLIGFFVNTQVLRTRVDGTLPFRELLKRVRETVLGAQEHQDVPFERLVEALQPERSLGRSPFFQVMFAMQTAPRGPVSVQGVKLQATEVDTHTSKFDLVLQFSDTEQGIQGNLEYDTELFVPETVARLVEHFLRLLGGMVARPDEVVSRLPMMADAERQQVLVAWNQTRTEYPSETCIHHLVEAQALRAPDAEALAFEGVSLSYGALEIQANRLAHHLKSRGVGPEVKVGVLLERSPEWVVAQLAILKAGGAFVPLDPGLPAQRLGFMLEDGGVRLLVTQEPLLRRLAGSSVPAVCLDTEAAVVEACPATRPDSEVGADHLAYVIYTSGSTGRPKGTLLAHRGLCNTALAAVKAHGVTERSRVLQFAALGFDAAVCEVFSTLVAGACLVLAPRERLLPDEPLRSLLEEQGVTTVTLTPSVLARLRPEGLPRLETVLSAGEALPRETARRWSQGRVLLNAYGPTEVTVCASITPAPGVRRGEEVDVSIGRPWANTTVYVLDGWGQVVPVGAPGELYVAGVGLARGYLGRPELTAERFVPNPFSEVPGARLYRTGDKARWRGDGTLEFLGRTDFQVKLRGFRIELGEVGSALGQFPGVAEAVAAVREDSGDARLVGYVVPTPGQTLEVEALQAHLREKLPEYMVPSAVVVLEALPLTSNGKVDRKALPAPKLEGKAEAYVAPRTPTEETLATIWAEVLKVPRVGVKDGFFELGGHSLLATQVMARVRMELGVEPPLRALFETPTVEALAARLEKLMPSRAQVVADVPRRLLSFAQQRLWFIDQMDPGSPVYNVPGAVRMDGVLDVGVLQRALDEVVRRHEALRTTFHEHEGQPIQVIDASRGLPLSMLDLTGVDADSRPDEARRQVEKETQRSFNLRTGPLVRALLVKLGEQEHVLVITMHHIVSDGWSVGVLVREVGMLYAAFAQGQPSPLPELPLQYADHAAWQRGYLRGEVLERQLDYWKQQLAGAPPVLELPTDKPRPAARNNAGAMHPFTVSRELAERLKSLGRQEGASLFMVLLTGAQVLLSRYAGQDDLSVGTPIAGRTRAEVEGLIGFFVNTLVLRTQVRAHEPFRAMLQRVRERVLGAYEHQEVPFEKLVEVLQPTRSLSHTPLIQAMVALQNMPMGELRLPGMVLKPLELDGRTSKFDLSLFFFETPQQGMVGSVVYSTALFEARTVARMVEHLKVLLEAAVSGPDVAVGLLPLLPVAERQRLLVEWNDTRREVPWDGCFHERFETQAARTPDAVAVLDGVDQLDFAELNRRANQLARFLRERGVGPEVRVALCLERSVALVVAALGILKAGGAYVPLDPAWPSERLALLLRDCGARLVLTQKDLAEAVSGAGLEVVCLDDERQRETLSRLDAGNPPRLSEPRHLAYVIYTSGSTGRPKGVMVQHGSVMNLRAALADTVYSGVYGARRVSLNAPLAFDASVKQLIQVSDGHALCVVPQEAREDVALMRAWLGRHEVDVLDCSPSHLRLLLDEGLGAERPVRVLAGGEAVDEALWGRLAAHPRITCFNVYGPTECTVDATVRVVREDAVRPSLGKPLMNVRVYVLDERLQPVPMGVPGELFIGGLGVARGYLDRPELTADRFIPDPFGDVPGARLYRTGDKVRWRVYGELEYLGRIDFQVKLRGFRIELGEIEAVLEEVAGVSRAVVLAREDVPGQQRLVAYLVPEEGQALDARVLREHLGSKLPEYMVPAAFVSLEAMPLTSNGKVDRKALPVPDVQSVTSPYVAPRTDVEETLASIWTEVLNVPRVGVRDNFFELGGHSLLATQVASKVRGALGLEMPLRALFESPTVEGLVERLKTATRTQAPALTRVSRDRPVPLSFAQQRLWLIDQLEPGNAAYNMPTAVRLEGELNVGALEGTLREVVRRHETLRTTFREDTSGPVQVISPEVSLNLTSVDLTRLPELEREAAARRQVMEEMRRPFFLEKGPLVRAVLLKLGEQVHVLVVTMHHIISDGWSLGVLVREVAALYSAAAQGQAAPLPELALQYAEYAEWQRGRLRGEALQAEVDYWKRKLSGAPPVLELPTDRPRPAVRGNAGTSWRFILPRALGDALKARAQEEGGSLFMVLLAGWQALLSRYTGQEDISVGSPIAGRTRAEVEGLIGFFVNTLVLRARVDGAQSFRALLKQVRETVLEAYEHQEVPFEKLVEALQPARSLSYTPLFQSLMALQNTPATELRLPGLVLKSVELESRTSKFDLSLFFFETPQGLRCSMEYSTDLFDAATVRRMAGHLGVLLEGIAAHPDVPLSSLPLLTEAERQQVLVEWNATTVDSPTDAPVHVLFARQAERTPESVALVQGEARLTYAELEARANQLAHHLRALGVSVGSRVGLCVERSPELVVGLLGILKAGAAYVPVDRNAPVERVAGLLEDAGVEVMVGQESLAGAMPSGVGRRVWLDTEWDEVAARPRHAPEVEVGGEDLAYVMFTSGSTGRPKGVCVPHRGVVRLVMGGRFVHFGPKEVWLQSAPVAFDASTLEVWGALLHGAKLVLAPPHALTLEELAALLRQEQVTSLWLTAALFEQVALHQGEALAGVRQVLAGGDVLPAQRVREHLKRLPEGAVLVNGYGPTENTTFSTTHALRKDSEVVGTVPIGRPLENSTAYVLDERMQPVPVGVAGEVYVGGQGLAWGYLNRPELTAEKFVPHPFSEAPGARLYRTGDQARWRADGTLEFLGRVDFQVKVRGFRIELGEVESALRGVEGVTEAVVVARGTGGDKRLVGYVVPGAGRTLEAEALKARLKQQLPEYMVPGALVVLDALPLNANGKVDRKALPEPEAPRATSQYVAPRTPMEEKLAAIWMEVLKVSRVGVRDSFFELGGHSLLATQVVSRVRLELGVELPLRTLFEAPTVEALAERLPSLVAVGAPQLTPVSREGNLPLSFAQQRLWLIDQLEPGSPLYNIPLGVRLEGALQVPVLERALQEVVRRHETLRTSFAQVDGQPVQVIHPKTSLPMSLVDLRGVPEGQREGESKRLVDQEMRRSFHLEKGPLVRALLLKLSESEHVLLLSMHHIISDGWSLGVLVREVGALYAAFVQGRPSPLPELKLQYAEYASWQRHWLRGEVLRRQVDYWKQKLSGAPPVLELPTDKPRPAVRGNAGTFLSFTLSRELTEGLKSLSRLEGGSLFMVLLAGWQTLLSRYTGQQDINVGSPIAGRTREEVESLIGFFVNTLVLRAQVEGGQSFRALLRQVRETVLEAYEYQEVPFEKLVEALQPTRSLSHTPLFQSMMALQNTPMGALRLPGMALKPVEMEVRTAKFDLSAFFVETPQGLRGMLEYSSELFEQATVRRVAEHLRVLLEGVVANPDEKVGRLPLLTSPERQQLLVTWNRNEAGYPRDATIPQLVEAQAQRTPDAVAVIGPEKRLTYRELDARANQLAHRLRKLGVGPEVRVGLCVERTADMVVGALGILKAGGAYVPLDPSYPKERLGWLLEDAQGPALVAHSGLLASLPEYSAQAVCLDTDEELARQPVSAPDAKVQPENLAYLIYTSGSTGRPKGVAIAHRNAVAFLQWALDTFSREELKGVLAATSLNFDLSVFEMFAPLSCGGTVVVARNALQLPELPAASEVTLINTVPSAMAQLVRLEAVPAGVSVVNLAGEALPGTLAKQVYGVATVRKLYNLYGPSEDTTYSTWSLVGREEEPNIGRPLTNTRAYVLDSELQPVPAGVAGELYLAGEGQARGYLLRPELTAERFVPEPYGPSGSRMYRTGDRVRYRADGVLEYLGRVDFQVKVRGFRIELGEVESALRAHSAVKEAVVMAKGEGADKRLVAYVVPKPEHKLEAEALKAQLRKGLPEYMVPGAVVVMEALPLNANGKVDRKALPEPDAPRATSQYVEPRTEAERTLAAIWADILRVPRVGARDSFFELGGHSLLATQVVSRVRAELGVEMPLRALFETPTVEGLAGRLSGLVRGDGEKLPRVSREAPLPLSFAQQRLWVIDQLESGSALYNVPVAVRLDGLLKTELLVHALHEVVRRHESLRTTFKSVGEEPVQVIAPDMGMPLETRDLSGLPGAEREIEARRLLAEEMKRPFHLEQGPLVRALLVKLIDSEHVLVVTMHHIISDGWSVGVTVREVGALYAAFVQGQPSPLPELPVQYADYAAWQRGRLQGELLQRQVDYWKQKLNGAPPVLELPTDKPRPAVRGNAGASHDLMLSRELAEGLKALARQEGGSLFMVLLAGWQVLLSRYSGQQDISVGSPIAGRTRAEVEGLIGFFINTLVLRAQVEGGRSFRELLRQVKTSTLEAYEYQEVPFEKLVEALQPARSLSHTPLFQSMMALQNTPTGGLRLPGMFLRPVEYENRTSKFDLSVYFVEREQGLSATLEYSTELFEKRTVERLAEHLRVLLEGVVKNPEELVGRLPMLTESERRQMLVEWNQTGAEYPRQSSIHALVEAQAQRTPDAVAVIGPEKRLTYRELDARANQLAHRLRKLGVGPEVRVGLCVERTADMVVGALGILKAGGAYVPLDPSYPKERLGWLLEDAQGPALVAHSGLLASLPEHSAQAVCLDTDEELARQPVEAPEVVVQPENLAYLIYTSGSTGRPKGVAIAHRNAVAFLQWALDTFTPEELKGVLAATSLNFDLSVFEMFAPLSCGGTVVVARNALQLPELPAAGEVTLINTVPSAMAQLVRLGAVPAGVRVVNLAGEALPGTLAKQVYGVGTVEKLYNLYGPSEDTTYSTWSLVGREEEPNIGRPLANTRAYVLDSELQPVPAGVAGELYLAGEGQARGYLLRPELTAERFVPEPYGPPGSRMYRTGDRVRYRADGVLEYLGRVDFQVKVRGFRIELGEVESVLRAHPAVKEAVVVAKGEGAEKRLVAYVVPKPEQRLEAEALKAQLRKGLPEYMVPGAVVVMEALPLNANGKVDRKALPEPDAPRATSQYVEPRTEAERTLAAIWADILRVPRVGAKDSFFELGGHSLLATQVVSRVRAELGVELPLRALFETPTVEGLAERLKKLSRGAAPQLVRVSREAPLPLSFAQQRLWLIDQIEPGSALYNVPVPVRLEGSLETVLLARALDEVVRRHEALRTTFRSGGEEPVQVIAAEATMPLETRDLSGLPVVEREAEARLQVAREAQRPFDLEKGPLVRALLLKLSDSEHVLVVTMHHIISDGWSLGVMVREVGALYAAFVQGRPSPLAELPAQYADYAAWQRGWLRGEVLQRQVDYWNGKLSGAPVLELPTDKPRPAVRGNAGATHGFTLSLALTAGLKGLARQEGGSLFMVLLAGWQVLLARYSGQRDISVGTPIAGRTQAEVEGLIGFFVNTLVLRGQVEGGASFRALLRQVKETVLGAYEHQEVPFEKLVEGLQPERSLSHTPLFQTLMALQNVPTGEVRLPGMALKPVEYESRTSKFDLSLFFVETPQGLRGTLEYSTELFEKHTVERLAEHLRVLFEGVVKMPGDAVGRLPMLTESERRQVVKEWNATASESPTNEPVHALFAKQAERTPEAVALVQGEERLTYAELDARANQLANHLRAMGVGVGARVGLCVERSFELVIGLLGILKAGAAYVPVDRNAPVERVAGLLEDAGAEVVVGQEALAGVLPPGEGRRLWLDTQWEEVAAQPRHAPQVEVGGEDLAYVMFTSGSTGRPKGVSVPHRGVVRLVVGSRFMSFGPEEVWLQYAPAAFDASTLEVWGALLHGAKLVLAPPRALTLEELAALLRQEKVTSLWLTAALFEQVALHQGEALAGVRQVLAGGDVLPAQRVREHLKRLPEGAVLINGYGPTENTTFSTTHALRRSSGVEGAVPIGRPLEDSTAYVLDERMQAVPVGVAGEVYVGGEGLAWGYLNRPELTAEKFVPHPFSAAPGARLYRTGDQGKWRADGTLEFLGRVDFQVKVRGFRIELGEVESALRGVEGVTEAVVVARGAGGDKRLVGYVVPVEGRTLEAEAVKAQLKQRLPEYMVPAVFMVLPSLPLNANGKVDRKALPEPEAPSASGEYVAPRDAVEMQLARVWEEVLGIRPVGVRSSFFELGGHSLLAVRMVASLRESTGRSLPLATLFQQPTIEQLARVLREESREWTPLVPLERGEPERRPLFLVHPGSGNVLPYGELARRLGPEQPVYGLQARGLEGQPALETVEEMAALYLEAIRTVQPRGPYQLGGWSLGGVIAYEMARQLRAGGEAVDLLVLVDAYVPGVSTPANEAALRDLSVRARVSFARTVAEAFGKELPLADEVLERSDDETMLGHLLEEGLRARLLDAQTGRAQLRALFNVYRANLLAMERYVPQPYEGTALLLSASEPTSTAVPRHRGWEALVQGSLEIQDVPGTHHALMETPHLDTVVARLREALEK